MQSYQHFHIYRSLWVGVVEEWVPPLGQKKKAYYSVLFYIKLKQHSH